MPNIQSAKKRLRQSLAHRLRNRSHVSRVRTFVKKVGESVDQKQYDESMKNFKNAMREIHKGVSKGVYKKNMAARLISRLNKKVKVLS